MAKKNENRANVTLKCPKCGELNYRVEKNKKIKEIITKVENIDSTYKNSKDNLLYQLLDDNSKN